MKVSKNILAVVVLVVIFGGIFLSSSLGLWLTKSSKIPVAIKEGEFAGEANPMDIRGSYSFADVAKAFSIDEQILLKAFYLEGEDASKVFNKSLETIYANAPVEIGNSSMQLFVALYKEMPVELSDGNLPTQAVEILQEEKKLSEEQLAYFKTHQVDLSTLVGTGVKEIETLTPSEKKGSGEPKARTETSDEPLITGKTAIAKLKEYGITDDQIRDILGEVPASNVIIKDFAVEKGLSFSEIKAAFTKILEEMGIQ